MYAVIQTGGKQYRVRPGDVIVVEKLEGDVGAQMTFDTVLMMGGDKGVSLGSALQGATVSATLIETRKGEKVKVFKKIRRQGYRRTQGHRQFESVLRITSLEGAGQSMKWDGEVDLTPRSELLLRARGLASTAPAATPAAAPQAAAAKAAPKATAPKAAKADAKVAAEDETAMMDTPISEQVEDTPAKAPAKSKAPKVEAETPKAAPAPKKAKAPKAEAAPTASEDQASKKAAAPKKPKAAPKGEAE